MKPIVNSTCSFCSEIHGIDNEINLLQQLITPETGLQSRIIYETDHFVVMPTLGAFVEGYLLIVSKEHSSCIGKLSAEYIPELSALCQQLKQIISSHYDTNVVCFEHGSISCSNKFGGCIDHAHLHIVPCMHEQIQRVQKYGVQLHPIDSITTLLSFGANNQPYLFFEDTTNRQYVAYNNFIPSQFFRKILASEYGISNQWDWRKYHHLENIIGTINTFKHLI